MMIPMHDPPESPLPMAPFGREISMTDSNSPTSDPTEMSRIYRDLFNNHTISGRNNGKRSTTMKRRSQAPLGRPFYTQGPRVSSRAQPALTLLELPNVAPLAVPRINMLTKLPYELTVRVLRFLDLQSLARLSLVSKTWYNFSHCNEEWRRRMAERKWLLSIPADLRISEDKVDWLYWFKQRYQLERRWTSGEMTSHCLLGHSDCVYCVQFDDRKIISGSRDRTIKIWDLSSYQCIKTLVGHEKSVLCLQYDDSILVSGSSDATLIVWSMVTLEPLGVLKGHGERILDVCFDQQFIVSASKDTTIRIWDRNDGHLVRVLRGHQGPVNAVRLYGQNHLISASSDATIKIWDLQSGECIREFKGHKDGIAALQCNGTTLVSGSNDKTIKAWDIETGECLLTCYGHTDLVRTLDLSSDKIVSGSYDGSVCVWNKTGRCVLKFEGGHDTGVLDVRFDRRRIVSTGQDGKILILDFSDGLDTRFFDR